LGGIKDVFERIIGGASETRIAAMILQALQGELDAKPMKVSPKSTGHKLVLKGWQGKNDLVSVRYCANWDNLDGGEITFKRAADKGYKATTGGKAVYAGGSGKLTLKLSFKDTGGTAHVAKFIAAVL
jgi:hypothetical protein